MAKEIKITVTDSEYKALEYDIYTPQTWGENFTKINCKYDSIFEYKDLLDLSLNKNYTVFI